MLWKQPANRLLLIVFMSLSMVLAASAPAWAVLNYGGVGFMEAVSSQRGSFCYTTVDPSMPYAKHLNSVYLYKDDNNYLEFGWLLDNISTLGPCWFVYGKNSGQVIDQTCVGAPTLGETFGLKVVSTGVNSTTMGAYAKRDGVDWPKYSNTFPNLKAGYARVGTERQTVNDSDYANWSSCQRLANTTGALWKYWTSPYENPAPGDPSHDPSYGGYIDSHSNSNLFSLSK